MSVIANKYGTSVSALKQANNLKSNTVRIGQVLMIPGKTPAVSHTSSTAQKSSSTPSRTVVVKKTVTHTVKRGEFLGKIANQYGVSVSSIRSANRLRSDELAVGQKLKIDVSQRRAVQHTVKRGEFLGKIAAHYGVSIDSLRRANKLRSDQLAVGQKLTIPSS